MSFALDYRRKMRADADSAQHERAALERANAGFVVMPAGEDADTRGNRRRALAMISLAGIILSFFNSSAMVRYAGGLSDSDIGMQVIVATENWHHFMEENRLTLVVEEIRGAVSQARHSDWPDLASGLGFRPGDPRPEMPDQSAPVDRPIEDTAPGEHEPEIEITKPAGPVLRAAAQ